MPRETDAKKLHRYKATLEQFVERAMADRYVLAVVEVGSLRPETIWASISARRAATTAGG